MKKILWVSRHAMTIDQKKSIENALGKIKLYQVNGNIKNINEPFISVEPEMGETISDVILIGKQQPLKDLVQDFDEVAVVLPYNMIQELLPFVSSGRVLMAMTKRVLVDGKKEKFVHDRWVAIKEVKIVTDDL